MNGSSFCDQCHYTRNITRIHMYICTYVLNKQEHICMNVLYCCSHAHTYMHVKQGHCIGTP